MMIKAMLFLAASAALPVAAYALTPQSPDAMLAGRTPGPPQDCLSTFERDRESQLFRDGSILFRGAGGTWYLNRPENCPAFTSDRTIVSVTPGSLCRGDIIQVVQASSGAFYGSCGLGSFVPYAHAK